MNKKAILFTLLFACATQTTQPNIIGEGIDLFYDHSGKIAAFNIASFAAALIVQKALIQPQIKKLKNKKEKQKTRKLLKAINALLYAIEVGNIIVTLPALGLFITDCLGLDTVYETKTINVKGEKTVWEGNNTRKKVPNSLIGMATFKISKLTGKTIINMVPPKTTEQTQNVKLYLEFPMSVTKTKSFNMNHMLNGAKVILGAHYETDLTNFIQKTQGEYVKQNVTFRYKYTPYKKNKLTVLERK